MGLSPGEYVVRVDPDQLKNLNMTVSPESIPVKINQLAEGDVVTGLDFVLNPIPGKDGESEGGR